MTYVRLFEFIDPDKNEGARYDIHKIASVLPSNDTAEDVAKAMESETQYPVIAPEEAEAFHARIEAGRSKVDLSAAYDETISTTELWQRYGGEKHICNLVPTLPSCAAEQEIEKTDTESIEDQQPEIQGASEKPSETASEAQDRETTGSETKYAWNKIFVIVLLLLVALLIYFALQSKRGEEGSEQ